MDKAQKKRMEELIKLANKKANHSENNLNVSDTKTKKGSKLKIIIFIVIGLIILFMFASK